MVTFSHTDPGTAAEDWVTHPRWSTLPRLDLADETRRLVVLAAHPDDESLGAGGLIACAHHRGLEVVVVAATDGEASHPGSPTRSPELLGRVRRAELAAAMELLAPGAEVRSLGLADGRLAQHEEELVTALVELVGDGRQTVLVAPWRHDGHADHDAAGRSAAAAAARTGARLLEYPIWFWHWARPEAAPWGLFRALALTANDATAKADAQRAHRSQIEPLSDRPGDETLLTERFLSHFSGRQEVFVADAPQDPSLDELHARHSDPWGTDSRWYEERKRAILISALPRARFRHGLEIGSSTGALAEALATRCDRLVVVDASAHAVAAARARMQGRDGIVVEQLVVPQAWPSTPADGFDLVVLSEVGYFLSPRALEAVVERIRATLSPDGVVVLCHWQHEIVGWPLDGRAVHQLVESAGLRPVVASYSDRDVELLVLAVPDALPDPRGDR